MVTFSYAFQSAVTLKVSNHALIDLHAVNTVSETATATLQKNRSVNDSWGYHLTIFQLKCSIHILTTTKKVYKLTFRTNKKKNPRRINRNSLP